MKSKQDKEQKPKLTSVFVRDISTGAIFYMFPPTSTGIKRAERFRGLAGLEVVKQYDNGELK